MTRHFGHHIAVEMALLSLAELGVSFFAFNRLVCASGCPPGLPALAEATAFTLMLVLVAAAVGLYHPKLCLHSGRVPLGRLAVAASLAALLGVAGILIVATAMGWDTSFLTGDRQSGTIGFTDPSRPVLIIAALIALLITSRLAVAMAASLVVFRRRILIIGNPADAGRIEAALRTDGRARYSIAGLIPPGAPAAPDLDQTGRIWRVVACCAEPIHAPDPGRFQAPHITGTAFIEQHLGKVDLANLPPDWARHAQNQATPAMPARVARRALDIAGSLALLGFLSPVMGLAALAIRCEGPGPLLYRQTRIGQYGRHFVLLKFRSMRVDAEPDGPAWAGLHDQRVTRVGAFLQRARVDELPQLINVLRGDMSLVGPRPERPHFVALLTEHIPHYTERTRVKPGITGWAQVNYPDGASIRDAREKLTYDLYYIKHRSLLFDLRILLATIRVMLFQEGSR